ncbi:hypothetical protein DXG01_004752 [Tephrocybe rancida]|nr:hypothetical protein DXG01_004752 [Tephrocybe rancida]
MLSSWQWHPLPKRDLNDDARTSDLSWRTIVSVSGGVVSAISDQTRTGLTPRMKSGPLRIYSSRVWLLNALRTQITQAAADLQKLSKQPQVAETLPPASVTARALLQDDKKETEIKVWSDISCTVNNITPDLPNVDVAPLSTASRTEAPGPSTSKWFIIPNVAAAPRLIQNESLAFLQFDGTN